MKKTLFFFNFFNKQHFTQELAIFLLFFQKTGDMDQTDSYTTWRSFESAERN